MEADAWELWSCAMESTMRPPIHHKYCAGLSVARATYQEILPPVAGIPVRSGAKDVRPKGCHTDVALPSVDSPREDHTSSALLGCQIPGPQDVVRPRRFAFAGSEEGT